MTYQCVAKANLPTAYGMFDIHSFERDYPSLCLTIYASMAESYFEGYKQASNDAINILKNTNEKP